MLPGKPRRERSEDGGGHALLFDGELQAIKAASLLHDIGKIGIPEHILNKPGRLTASEFEIMKRHAEIGADITGLTKNARERKLLLERAASYAAQSASA